MPRAPWTAAERVGSATSQVIRGRWATVDGGRMAKPGSVIWGVFLLLFGAALLGWVGYNLLVERLPATKGMSPLFAILFGIGAVIAGVFRIRGQKPPPFL